MMTHADFLMHLGRTVGTLVLSVVVIWLVIRIIKQD